MSHQAPHFVGIGAQRAGTGWLYKNLRRHPDFFLAPLKEVHYFDSLDDTALSLPKVHQREYRLRNHLITCLKSLSATAIDRERNWDLTANFWWNYFSEGSDLDWYTSLFSQAAQAGKITGEITPAYALLSEPYIKQLKDINRDLKIIYILRNPIDRSFSHATKALIKGKNTKAKDISTENLIDFVKSRNCYERSDYLKSIRNFQKYFSPENMFICFFDEIQAQPVELLQRIYQFLGVKEVIFADNLPSRKVNSSSYLKKMPQELAQVLIDMYREDMQHIARELGGYAVNWLESVQEQEV